MSTARSPKPNCNKQNRDMSLQEYILYNKQEQLAVLYTARQ